MNRYLHLAMGVALTSTCRQKHGALVVRHGRILGAAPNVTKNDPKYIDWKHASIHAEIRAMKRANWPRKAVVYVARVSPSTGQPMLSKPCANCAQILEEFQCKVHWTLSLEESS